MLPLSLFRFFIVGLHREWGNAKRPPCTRSVTATATVLGLVALPDQFAFALAALVATQLAGLADGHVALAAAVGAFRVLRAAIGLLFLAHLLAPVVIVMTVARCQT